MTPTADEQYLREIGRWLHDLPTQQRQELLDELAAHLADGGPMLDRAAYDTRYGTPRRYALELRRAAGLPPPRLLTPRRVVVAIATLAVTAAGVTGFVWAKHYQPLSIGSGCGRFEPQGTPVTVGTQTEVRLTYDDAKAVRIVWPLNNNGGRPVTVSEIGITSANIGLGDAAFGIGPPHNRGDCATAQQTTPFKPFTLHPYETRSLVLTGRFSGCDVFEAGSSAGISSIPVKLAVYGIHHVVDMPLNPSFMIQFTNDHPCPRARP